MKLSPSARYILLGAGVRARYAENREGPEARGSERQGEVEERAAEIQEGAGAHGGEAQGNHPSGVPGGGTPSQPPVTSIYRAADLQPMVRQISSQPYRSRGFVFSSAVAITSRDNLVLCRVCLFW